MFFYFMNFDPHLCNKAFQEVSKACYLEVRIQDTHGSITAVFLFEGAVVTTLELAWEAPAQSRDPRMASLARFVPPRWRLRVLKDSAAIVDWGLPYLSGFDQLKAIIMLALGVGRAERLQQA